MEWKGAEDARYPEFLTTTPVDVPVKSEDDTADDGTRASSEGGGSSAAASPGLCQREAYCLLVRVTRNVDSVSALDAKVSDYVWTEAIARDTCVYQVGAPANAFTVELLCDTEFLLFEGPWSGLGITWENAIKYIWVLHEIRDWGGMEVTVVASQCTMRQSRINLAKTREYCRAAMEGKAQMLALENAKTPTPMGRGRAYTRRADQYLAQKVAGGPALEPSLHPLRPATPEDYHSAREPSEFEDGSEESEGSGADSTGYSSTTTTMSHCDTDHTQWSDTKNRDHRCRKQKHRDWWASQKTNAKKLKDRQSGRVVLPLFQESTKEGVQTYTDWRLEVEEYITKGYSRPKIKDAMFTSLEGKAKRNYQACDEKGDLMPEKILEKMDMIYRTSMSFQVLNAKLCGLKQGPQESPKDYYERMVDISVALKEYPGDRFQPGELTRMKKACFFASLQENYKYLVSHLKDQEDIDLVFMLKEIRECDESHYLASTSNAPKVSSDGTPKSVGYYDKKNYDRHGYGSDQAHAANIPDEPDDYQPDSLSEVESGRENDDVQQDKSYHVRVTMTADEGEAFFGKCYNCGEPGHPWRDCKKPLKPALRLALNSELERKAWLKEKKKLNLNGGTGVKGGRIPKAPLAPVQN